MQLLPTVRGAISVSAQPALREETTQKVKTKKQKNGNIFPCT